MITNALLESYGLDPETKYTVDIDPDEDGKLHFYLIPTEGPHQGRRHLLDTDDNLHKQCMEQHEMAIKLGLYP